jgi:hypothetical protein
VTVSRYQLVLLILLVVAGTAVGVAVYYIEHVYKARESFVEKIREGKPEELVEKRPPPTVGTPPLARSTSRGVEVLVVTTKLPASGPAASTRPASSRKVVTIRGNGEFTRLPALPDEPGPVVTGLLDRGRVDDLIRSVDDAPDSAGSGDYVVTALLSEKRKVAAWSREKAREILQLAGKEMNRAAVPERVFLRTHAAEAGPANPWPFQRAAPETFQNGAELVAESDRTRFRQGLSKLLEKDARFSFKDKVWTVGQLDLLP